MLRFLCERNESCVPGEDGAVLTVARGRTLIAALVIPRHRVPGLLLDLQKAVRGEVDIADLCLEVEQFEGSRDIGDFIIDDCARDGDWVRIPDEVVLARGAVERAD